MYNYLVGGVSQLEFHPCIHRVYPRYIRDINVYMSLIRLIHELCVFKVIVYPFTKFIIELGFSPVR